MVPPEVVLFLTLEVVLFLTLEGLKSGTETIGSAITDPVRFKLGFRRGTLKDKFALFDAYKSPIYLRGEKLFTDWRPPLNRLICPPKRELNLLGLQKDFPGR